MGGSFLIFNVFNPPERAPGSQVKTLSQNQIASKKVSFPNIQTDGLKDRKPKGSKSTLYKFIPMGLSFPFIHFANQGGLSYKQGGSGSCGW